MESPLIASITAQLAGRIRDGVLSPGQVLPSERELSADFRASRGVIRAAIRDLASKGLIEIKPRCRPAVISRPTSVGIRSGQKPHIGIWLWPNTGDFAAASILKGIQSADLGQEVNLVVANAIGTDWDSIFESEAKFLRSVAEDPQGAGVIIWYLGGDRNLDALRDLQSQNVPVVFVDRLPPAGYDADFVGTHNEGAAQRSVKHLIDLGHRRIALVSNIEPVSSVREREAGYVRALREAGIAVRDEYILRDLVDGPEGANSVVDICLNLGEPPTAIFAVNDHIALQVCDTLRGRNISIPHQMSVIGFDGLLRWVPGGGYLTTSLQDFERIGRLAAETVIHRMNSEGHGAYRHIMLDAPLLDRGSTAQPPARITHPMHRDPNP